MYLFSAVINSNLCLCLYTLYLCLLCHTLNRVIYNLNNCNWFFSCMDVDCVGRKVWIELVHEIRMNVSPQRVEFGTFPTWVTVLQLMDENHMDVNRAVAEVNVCLILLWDYVSCTHLWLHYLKSLLRFWTSAVPQNYIKEIILFNCRYQYYRP